MAFFRPRSGVISGVFVLAALMLVTGDVGSSTVQARPLRERDDPKSLCRSGLYTDTLGHASSVSFESPHACDLYVRNGGTLYPLPSAVWTERIETVKDAEGTSVTWCHAVLTVRNLDPHSSYTANVNIQSTFYQPVVASLPVSVNGKGVGTLDITFEECGSNGASVMATAIVLEVTGVTVATAGPTTLFP